MRVASDWISLEPYQMTGVWIPLAKELSTFSPFRRLQDAHSGSCGSRLGSQCCRTLWRRYQRNLLLRPAIVGSAKSPLQIQFPLPGLSSVLINRKFISILSQA